MKLKTVTLLGMIASILSVCNSLLYLLVNSGIMEFSHTLSILANLVSIFSGASLALFFYTLYKNQK